MIEKFQEHASNERTCLSWIRTAVAIAGFGIVIERLPSNANSTWTGLALVISSAVLVALASLRFLVIRRQIERSDAGRSMFGAIEVLFSSMLAVLLLTVFVFLLGLARGG